MILTEAAFDLYERLASGTFLVIDCEYTTAGKDNHLISIAVVPVVGGKVASANDQLYNVMRPGVPIDAASSRVHGFTDEIVKGKRTFAHYAPGILRALSRPDAVFVAHTGADLRCLRGELERLATAGGPLGLDDLPRMPILDTSTLPQRVHLDGVGDRPVISLSTLCELTNVKNTSAHHAQADARATAEALLALLMHAARTGQVTDLPELLAAHGQGDTHSPSNPGYIRDHGPKSPVIPDTHLGRHNKHLSSEPTAAEYAAWIDTATECARLRCPWLNADARLVAAAGHSRALLPRIVAVLPTLTVAGEAGTLLGAASELCDPLLPMPVVTIYNALKWWAKLRPHALVAPACTQERSCPACVEGQPCPKDTLYQVFGQIAVLGQAGELSERSIRDRLVGSRPDRRINSWAKLHPDITAYMMWMIVAWSTERGGNKGAQHLQTAQDKGLHLLEPRLAQLVYEQMLNAGETVAAEALVDDVLTRRTTDSGYTELALTAQWHRQGLIEVARRSAPRLIRQPRSARPEGRENRNPYAL